MRPATAAVLAPPAQELHRHRQPRARHASSHVVDDDVVRGAQPITLGAGNETEGFALPVTGPALPNWPNVLPSFTQIARASRVELHDLLARIGMPGVAEMADSVAEAHITGA